MLSALQQMMPKGRSRIAIFVGLAVAALAVGWMLDAQARDRNAAIRGAIMAGPPAATAVEDYQHTADPHGLDEVHLTGQLDLAGAVLLPDTGLTPSGYVYAVPLMGVSRTLAQDAGPVPADAVLLFDGSEFGPVGRDVREVLTVVGSQGPLGPVVRVNGTLSSLGWDERAYTEVAAAVGRAVAPGIFVVAPFTSDRAVHLAPPLDGEVMAVWAVVAWACLVLLVPGILLAPPPVERAKEPTEAYTLPRGQKTELADWQRVLQDKIRTGRVGKNTVRPGAAEDFMHSGPSSPSLIARRGFALPRMRKLVAAAAVIVGLGLVGYAVMEVAPDKLALAEQSYVTAALTN